jgi:hypothetical protein
MVGDVATLEIDVDGNKVIVSIEPKPGTKITVRDAEVIFTSAVGHLPQRKRL